MKASHVKIWFGLKILSRLLIFLSPPLPFMYLSNKNYQL